MDIVYKKIVMHQNVNGVEEDTELLVPDFKDEKLVIPVGKWGRLHLAYLLEYKLDTVNELIATGKLNDYLIAVDRDAKELMNCVIEDMKKRNGVTEELKERDQMAWVREMEYIRQQAEDVVFENIIYV